MGRPLKDDSLPRQVLVRVSEEQFELLHAMAEFDSMSSVGAMVRSLITERHASICTEPRDRREFEATLQNRRSNAAIAKGRAARAAREAAAMSREDEEATVHHLGERGETAG